MITFLVTVPGPSVSVTALSNQTVGQSLMLECNVTTVRGINRNVDIMWNVSNGTVIKTINGANISHTTSTSLVYTDIYTILVLSVADDEEVYLCETVINTSPQLTSKNNVTLNVTSEYTQLQYIIKYSCKLSEGEKLFMVIIYCKSLLDYHCSTFSF